MRSAKLIGNEKEWWVSHYGVVYKLNLIANLSRISDWSVHSRSYFFRSTGTGAVSTDSPLRRKAGLKFTHRGQASRTGPMNPYLTTKDDSNVSIPCLTCFIYVLMMTIQSITQYITRPDNCGAVKWNVISNWLDIDFIYSHIHNWSCSKDWSPISCISSVWKQLTSSVVFCQFSSKLCIKMSNLVAQGLPSPYNVKFGRAKVFSFHLSVSGGTMT